MHCWLESGPQNKAKVQSFGGDEGFTFWPEKHNFMFKWKNTFFLETGLHRHKHKQLTFTSPSPSPSPKSKPQIPKSQIQRGEGEFGLWAVSKILLATTRPFTSQLLEGLSRSSWFSPLKKSKVHNQ